MRLFRRLDELHVVLIEGTEVEREAERVCHHRAADEALGHFQRRGRLNTAVGYRAKRRAIMRSIVAEALTWGAHLHDIRARRRLLPVAHVLHAEELLEALDFLLFERLSRLQCKILVENVLPGVRAMQICNAQRVGVPLQGTLLLLELGLAEDHGDEERVRHPASIPELQRFVVLIAWAFLRRCRAHRAVAAQSHVF